jgi:hypothetical protein
MMEGAHESDLLKDTFPLPRKHTPSTMLFEHDDFPAGVMQEQGRRTDLLSVCKHLFQFERYGDNSKVITTFNGVCRAGEAKFLTYWSMMLDETYGIVFVQLFQRKSLKTNPSGIVPDWEHPEMCFFLNIGCFWAWKMDCTMKVVMNCHPPHVVARTDLCSKIFTQCKTKVWLST